MAKTDLTLAICSNNIQNLASVSLPFLSTVELSCNTIIILDDSAETQSANFLKELTIDTVKIVSGVGSGLSVLRNVALRLCCTKFILFIDDDVTFDRSLIEETLALLNNGFTIVGANLISHRAILKWYLTSNQYHYLGIHNPETSGSIWGAFMAFNLTDIQRTGLQFDESLGRQKKKLLNGEDTSFIKALESYHFKSTILKGQKAIHHVDKNKTHFDMFVRRVFWQGITEVKRSQTSQAIRKEVMRNFNSLSVANVFIGAFWMLILISGIATGLMAVIIKKLQQYFHINAHTA